MTRPITFHTGPWTLGDLLMARRLVLDEQDIDAFIALLVSRSDATEADILALPVTELEPLVKQMADTLQTAGVMDLLARLWSQGTAPKG
jgi:hypothetical protein